jgi:hypothetical protein
MPDNTVARINVSLDKAHRDLVDKLLIHLYQTKKLKPQVASLMRYALRELAKANSIK